ncbi:MAG: endonuclease/exonuclease/phosphatase family protein [Bythopirellula sp.]|nr:endonuclease/exonuclease/phosphatase family protein [Bythopirellula sp.]
MGFVQRLLSLGTLGVIGYLSWLFLQGGGLGQMAVRPDVSAGQQAAQYRSPGSWNGTTPPPATTPGYQPVSSDGAAIPPPGQPNSGPVIRIAAFNIQAFGNTKAAKQYVMVRLADIIRKFDIVAIQEIRSQNEYLIPNFVQLINQPGRRYDHVIGERLGRSNNKEQYVYIFDTERIAIDPLSVYTISDPDDLMHREPLVATFMTTGVDPDEAFTFTLVNVHTEPNQPDLNRELDGLAEVYRVVRRSARQEDDVILLGDFNVDDRHLQRLGQLPGIFPLIAGVATNTRQDQQFDNIIIHQSSTTEYAGRSGVFDVMRNYNLNEAQALEISDHFPVWAEFSVYERDYAGRVANRRFIISR